jgi:hypothetical protein
MNSEVISLRRAKASTGVAAVNGVSIAIGPGEVVLLKAPEEDLASRLRQRTPIRGLWQHN